MKRYCCTRKLEIRDHVYDEGLRRIPAPETPLRVLPGMVFTAYPGEENLLVAEPPYIHMECLDTMWIEVRPEILAEFFEEVPY